MDRGFERLYRRHVADVYHYALAVLRNPADAEDVTQTTFLNALRAYERGERPRAEQNWLIAIAHNVCRQRFRQSQRRPREVSLDEDVADHVVDEEAPSADDIRRALEQLAFNQRAALVMRELEGRSYADIADILGVSSGAVETLLFRARRALREQLEGSLTCRQAELAISKQLDGRLARSERGALRAHLRACPDCATVARRHRAHRSAFKALGAVPLPTSLTSLFGGGGGAAVGTGVAAKAAAVVATGALVGGVGYEGAKHTGLVHRTPRPAAAAKAKAETKVQAPAPTPTLPAVFTTPSRRPPVVSHAKQGRSVHSRAHHPTHPVHPVRAGHPTHPIHPTHPAHARGRSGRVTPGASKGRHLGNGNREQAQRGGRVDRPEGRKAHRQAKGKGRRP